MSYDVIIAGAGVIGGMLARELSKYQLRVCLLERCNDVACGASKANSGIIHGGFDPKPNTLKAKMNIDGIEKLFHTAKILNVSCQRNGSFVCAFGADEEESLRNLYQRGIENGVSGMTLITGDEARKLEPNLSPAVTLVLNIPTSGIICPYDLTVAAVGNAMDNGVDLKLNFEVSKIEAVENHFLVTAADRQNVEGCFFVNCAGGYSDRISALVGDDSFHIIPRAGEYLLLDKEEGTRVSRTIFQVPSKEGKGILVTPTVDGNLLTGPTAIRVESPDSTETTAKGAENVIHLASKSVPSIAFRQVITSFSGVRSSENDGDFIIRPAKNVPHFLNVAAIDSPGLTCCVAIAEYAVTMLENMGLSTHLKANWDGHRDNPHAFRQMSDAEKDAYIKSHPDFGKIVCRCETVSEGEIRDAIRRNPPARDIDAIKRRTRSGMGRCQGGFCMPYIMKLLSEELGIPMEQVSKKGKGSEPLIGHL